ncbi:MAG: IclR family transcriptional regulator [Limnochordaceae bacterium]|nr:IclR family transcriptional regulator [Limnochordaceae bacterium]
MPTTGGSRRRRSPDAYAIASVDKAVRLLLTLGHMPGRAAGITELAHRLQLTKNQVFRLLKTLERHRLVDQDPGGSLYRLGSGLLVLAAMARDGLQLVRAASPTLDRLAMATGESIHLAAREGLEAVIVDVRESLHPVRLTAQVGGRYPLHAGACPRAILAFLPPEQQEQVFRALPRLPRYTRRTVEDPEALRRELDAIRQRGYAISDEDVDLGARAVGAPIFAAGPSPSADGGTWALQAVGALSIAGPTVRLPDPVLARYGEMVAAAAREISNRLGARAAVPAIPGADGEEGAR